MLTEEYIKKKSPKLGDIVIKKYGDKTVVSKYPDMSNIIPANHRKKRETGLQRQFFMPKQSMAAIY